MKKKKSYWPRKEKENPADNEKETYWQRDKKNILTKRKNPANKQREKKPTDKERNNFSERERERKKLAAIEKERKKLAPIERKIVKKWKTSQKKNEWQQEATVSAGKEIVTIFFKKEKCKKIVKKRKITSETRKKN